jgi:hypothetical protein
MMETQPKDNDHPGKEGATRPLASVLAIGAGLLRLVPHPWHFTPVGAVGLFAGARLRGWQAFALPLAVRAVTDLFDLFLLGFTTSPFMYLCFLPFVYVSLALNVLLGKLLRSTESPWRIGLLTLAASVQFFLLSNFGTWIMSPLSSNPEYPFTVQGLVTCYIMGLPFFRPTVLGDLAYAGALFGLHAWLSRTQFTTERVAVVTD